MVPARRELRGLRRPRDRDSWLGGSTSTLRRALSPAFSAAALAVFIPWRVVAANSARRSSTRAGRLVGAAAAGRTAVGVSKSLKWNWRRRWRWCRRGASYGVFADLAIATAGWGALRRLYVVLSLPLFRLLRSRSLSLGGWWPRIRRGAVAIKGKQGDCWPTALAQAFLKGVRFQRTSTRQQLDCAQTLELSSPENRRTPISDGLSTCS